MRLWIPNPSNPSGRAPARLGVTDRALRYRANANPPEGPEVCAYCGAGGRLDIEHLDGCEENGAPENLAWACRSCNTTKGATFARLGIGRLTRQNNPAVAAAGTVAKYAATVAQLLAGESAAAVKKAIRMMQATKPATRAKHAGALRKGYRSKNPGAPASGPTFAQYAYAVSIHQKGAHDEGGAIIHATPKDKRSEYARRLAAGRKRKEREEVPF